MINIHPPYLQAGDTIGIAASARKVSPELIAPALQTIENWGLKVKLCSNIYAEENQYAGSDQQRCQGLQQLLDDPDIKAIVFAKGGYGSVRIIDHLDFSTFKRNPKWLCGYSDITVFHNHIVQNFGIQTMHSVMLSGFPADGSESTATLTLKKALFGEKFSYKVAADKVISQLNKYGSAKGRLVGGNLSLLYALAGSVSDIDTRDKILFIEDLDEYLYHIDRMMQQLKRAGKINSIKGLIVGGLSDMKDNDIPFGKSAEQIVAEYAKELNIPVAFGFPAGHIEDNRALIMGAEVALEINTNETILNFL